MAGIVGRKGTASAYVGISEALTAEDKLHNLTSVTLPNPEAEEVDVTDFDSDGKENENGDTDYGTLEFNYNLVDAEQYDKLDEQLTTGSTVYFQYFIKNKEDKIVIGRKGKGTVKTNGLEGVERGQVISVSASIKVSGALAKVTEEPTATK